MTVENTTNKVSYAGDNSLTARSFSFKIFDAADLEVYVVASDGTETLKTNVTHYTVSINTVTEGGTVTPISGHQADTGETYLIKRVIDLEQDTNIPTEGNFPEESIENEFDQSRMIDIQQQEEIARSIKMKLSSTQSDITMEDLVANKMILVNSTGDGFEMSTDDFSTIQADLATVAGISANITTVAGIAANVTSVAGNAANITTVAGISANVTTVAGISADVSTVAADGTDIGTVAGISADVTAVAAVAANVTSVAAVDTDVTAVAGITADVTSVAGVAANVTTVAGIAANVTTVAGISANVTSVAGIAADVTTVAGNITTITDAANNIPKANRTATTAPTVTDDSGSGYSEGSLWVDVNADLLYFCLDDAVGAAVWQQVGASTTTFDDESFEVYDLGDNTRRMRWDVGTTVSTGQTRVLNPPNKNWNMDPISKLCNTTNRIGKDTDTNTYIDFSTNDYLRFYAGGINMLELREASTDLILLNGGYGNVDTRIFSDAGYAVIATDATNNVAILGSQTTAPTVTSSEAKVECANTDSMLIPRGTTAQRPATPVNGMVRYNSDNNEFEAYENGAWGAFGPAGGKLLGSAFTSAASSTSGTGTVDILSLAYTPKSSTSTIYLFATAMWYNNANTHGADFTQTGGSGTFATGSSGNIAQNAASSNIGYGIGKNIKFSNTSTSATTFKFRATGAGSRTSYGPSTLTLLEIQE